MPRSSVPTTGSRGAKGKEKAADHFPTIKVLTPPIRLSYPKIWEAIKNDQGNDVWELDALVPPDCVYGANHKDYPGKHLSDVLEDALFEVMEKYFGREDEWPQGRNDGHPKDKIRKVKPEQADLPGLSAKWEYFSCRSYRAVGIVSPDEDGVNQPVTNAREVYGGRWARLSLSVTVYDNKSKGPTIYLNNVQLLDNDESFGGSTSAESDFDDGEGRIGRRGASRDDGGRDRGERSDDRDGRRDGGEARGGSRGREDRGSDRDGRASSRGSEDDRRGSRDRDEPDSRGRGRDGDERGRGGRESDRDAGRGRGSEDRDGGRSRDRGDPDDRGRDREEAPERGRDDSRGGRGRGREDDRDRDGGERGSRASRDTDEDRSSRGRTSSREAEDEGRGRSDGGGRGRDRDGRDDEPRGGRSRGREEEDEDRWR